MRLQMRREKGIGVEATLQATASIQHPTRYVSPLFLFSDIFWC